MTRTVAELTRLIAEARENQDWKLHEELWDERRAAEVQEDEVMVRPTAVRFVDQLGRVTDIRFRNLKSARLAARINNDPSMHGPGWRPAFRAVFVLPEKLQ